MDRFNDMMDNLKELQAEYADYRPVRVQDLPFKEPETEEQKAKAKQLSKTSNGLLIGIFMAFIATLVFAIVTHASISGIILVGVLCVLIGFIVYKQFSQKVMVSTGKAIFKKSVRKSGRRYHLYYITFVPDGSEKVLSTRVLVSAEDYSKIVEGTRVMVINRGSHACILNEG